MSRFKQIRDAIKAGVPEDEAVAQALGVSKSSSKRSKDRREDIEPDDVPALPSMADAFKRARVKSQVRKRRG